jgi:prepilin-type N-terminal cleavage/methylation domain-containing protein
MKKIARLTAVYRMNQPSSLSRKNFASLRACLESREATALNGRPACSRCRGHNGTGETPVQLGVSKHALSPVGRGASPTRLRRRCIAGFTLLEMLAAVAVLGILVVLLFQTFNQASKGWEFGQARVETTQQARAALDFMGRELTQAISGNTTNATYFAGTATTVNFYAPVNTSNPPVDLCEVYYYPTNVIEGNPPNIITNPCLVRATYDWNRSGLGYGTLQGSNIVAQYVLGIDFKYFGGTAGTNVLVTPYNSLSYSNLPPSSVEITITNIDRRTVEKMNANSAAIGTLTNQAAKVFTLRVGIPNGNRRSTP